MGFLERVKNFFFDIATCYGLGNRVGGSLIASLLAIPLLLASRIILLIAPWDIFIQFFVFIFLSFIIVHFALQSSKEHYQIYGAEEVEKARIVLDKVVGMTITLSSISFKFDNFKIILLGYGLYHILLFIKPLLLRYEIFKKIESLPGALGILVSDIVFGMFVNVVVRIFAIL